MRLAILIESFVSRGESERAEERRETQHELRTFRVLIDRLLLSVCPLELRMLSFSRSARQLARPLARQRKPSLLRLSLTAPSKVSPPSTRHRRAKRPDRSPTLHDTAIGWTMHSCATRPGNQQARRGHSNARRRRNRSRFNSHPHHAILLSTPPEHPDSVRIGANTMLPALSRSPCISVPRRPIQLSHARHGAPLLPPIRSTPC